MAGGGNIAGGGASRGLFRPEDHVIDFKLGTRLRRDEIRLAAEEVLIRILQLNFTNIL